MNVRFTNSTDIKLFSDVKIARVINNTVTLRHMSNEKIEVKRWQPKELKQYTRGSESNMRSQHRITTATRKTSDKKTHNKKRGDEIGKNIQRAGSP